MDQARPLPSYLIARFQGWRATTYQDNRAWYRRLAERAASKGYGDFVLRQQGACHLDLRRG